jgi:hypothetical protein
MAEHTQFHLWLNTAVAFVALSASATSGYFAWQTYKLKVESLGFTIKQTLDCPAKFQKYGKEGFLSLCWDVTITNQSDTRISIVRFQAFDVSNKNVTFAGGFPTLENRRGETIHPPLSLGAGEPQQYLMRVPFLIPSTVAAIAETLPKGATLNQLQDLAFGSGLDIIGNKVDVQFFGEQNQSRLASWNKEMRIVTGAIHFVTGRGNIFIAQMSFPPNLR